MAVAHPRHLQRFRLYSCSGLPQLPLWAADEAWGSAKWVLEGAAEPLSGKQRKVVAEASGAYSAAVEASLEASMAPEHERDLTVGGYLRDAWPQARRSRTLRTPCRLNDV